MGGQARRFGYHDDGKPMFGGKEVLVGALATIVAAGIIGFASSWLGASTFRTEAEFRLKALEKSAVEIKAGIKSQGQIGDAKLEKLRSEWMLELRGLRADFKDLAKEVRAYLAKRKD